MEQDILTKSFAEARFKQISNVSYDIFIGLKKKSKTFEGKIAIHLTLKKKAQITLNSCAKIKKISVNSKTISNFKQASYLLTIPKEHLKKGDNTISIFYTSNFSHNGEGFHQFIDLDKREYLYSDFEPFKAHKMIPCFDQPDIKANFSLTVQAPKSWKTISNSPVLHSSSSGPIQTTKFKTTPKISTYLFHLSAGDYHEFKTKNKIPLRLFCRQSFKKYVTHNDFFRITKQGLNFYPKFFNYKYPFEKYDQIIVPEFNSGAMENPGCVTFSERYFPRRKMTYTERSELANVILHEMTHMWFGDLVTMKWWDDLWLNESFADFLSYLAMTKNTEFKTAWQDFQTRKAWGYYQDQLPTTHPIATKAEDTETAFSNFDGISYSKGASVLKQLLFYISEAKFKKAMQHYFKKHQWKNTTLSDFLHSLEKASNINLKPWFKSWIKTSGVNTITPKIKLSRAKFPAKISSFKILQTSKNRVLRPHKINLALFYNSKVLSLPITYSKKTTKIKSLKNKPLPNFLFLNYQDHDFVKVEFDPASLKYISNNFEKIPDNLTKQMVLGSLWEMTRDSKLNPRFLLNLALGASQKEKSLHTLEALISKTLGLLSNYVSDIDYCNYSEKLHQIAFSMYSNNKTPRDHKNIWFSALSFSAQAIKDPSAFEKLLSKKIDQDKRWSILTVLASRNHKGIEKLIKSELKRDNTDEGKKSAAQASCAMLKNKSKFWTIFNKENKYSLDYTRSAMQTFWFRTQKKQLTQYIDKFFKNAIPIFKNKSEHFGRVYSAYLFPSFYPTPSVISKSKLFLRQNPKAPKLLRKYIIEKIDGLERIHKVRTKYS